MKEPHRECDTILHWLNVIPSQRQYPIHMTRGETWLFSLFIRDSNSIQVLDFLGESVYLTLSLLSHYHFCTNLFRPYHIYSVSSHLNWESSQSCIQCFLYGYYLVCSIHFSTVHNIFKYLFSIYLFVLSKVCRGTQLNMWNDCTMAKCIYLWQHKMYPTFSLKCCPNILYSYIWWPYFKVKQNIYYH